LYYYRGVECRLSPVDVFVTDMEECASSPCGGGSTCIEEINGYNCVCAAGYTGLHCETREYADLARSYYEAEKEALGEILCMPNPE